MWFWDEQWYLKGNIPSLLEIHLALLLLNTELDGDSISLLENINEGFIAVEFTHILIELLSEFLKAV